MCVATDVVVSLGFTLLGFVLSCRVFSPLPFSVRFAVLAALLVLLMPSGDPFCGGGLLPWHPLVAALLRGVTLGAITSGFLYAIELFLHWLLALMLGRPRFAHRRVRGPIEGTLFLVLTVLSLQISSAAFPDLVLGAFLQSPVTQSAPALIKEIGTGAFSLALLLAVPYLVTVMLIDLALFVVNRFLRATARSSLQLSLRLPLLVMLLALSLYPHAGAIASGLGDFFGPAQILVPQSSAAQPEETALPGANAHLADIAPPSNIAPPEEITTQTGQGAAQP